MQSRLHKGLSLILSMWLVLTSVGATVDIHFCGELVYSVGINAKAQKCAGFTSTDEYAAGLAQAPCCSDYSGYFQNDLESSSDHVSQQLESADLMPPAPMAVRIPTSPEPIRLCHNYLPPDKEVVDAALFSVFRI